MLRKRFRYSRSIISGCKFLHDVFLNYRYLFTSRIDMHIRSSKLTNSCIPYYQQDTSRFIEKLGGCTKPENTGVLYIINRKSTIKILVKKSVVEKIAFLRECTSSDAFSLSLFSCFPLTSLLFPIYLFSPFLQYGFSLLSLLCSTAACHQNL